MLHTNSSLLNVPFSIWFFFLFEFWLEHVDLEGTEDRQSRVGETESASINATNL